MVKVAAKQGVASADIAASTVKGRLLRVVVTHCPPPATPRTSVTIDVRDAAGGDTGNLLFQTVVHPVAAQRPDVWYLDFGPDGVIFTNGLRLVLAQTGGTSNSQVDVTCIYAPDSGL